MIYLQKSQSTNKCGTKVKGCFLLTYAAIVMWNKAVAGLRALQRTMNYILQTMIKKLGGVLNSVQSHKKLASC